MLEALEAYIGKGASECAPAYVYFVVAVISTILLLFQNARDGDCKPGEVCKANAGLGIVMARVLVILVWTAVLRGMCMYGYTGVAWAFVIIPFLVEVGVVAGVMHSVGAPKEATASVQQVASYGPSVTAAAIARKTAPGGKNRKGPTAPSRSGHDPVYADDKGVQLHKKAAPPKREMREPEAQEATKFSSLEIGSLLQA